MDTVKTDNIFETAGLFPSRQVLKPKYKKKKLSARYEKSKSTVERGQQYDNIAPQFFWFTIFVP